MPTTFSLLSVERKDHSRRPSSDRMSCKHFILDPKQANVLGEIIEVFQVRPKATSSGGDDGGRFCAANVGKLRA